MGVWWGVWFLLYVSLHLPWSSAWMTRGWNFFLKSNIIKYWITYSCFICNHLIDSIWVSVSNIVAPLLGTSLWFSCLFTYSYWNVTTLRAKVYAQHKNRDTVILWTGSIFWKNRNGKPCYYESLVSSLDGGFCWRFIRFPATVQQYFHRLGTFAPTGRVISYVKWQEPRSFSSELLLQDCGQGKECGTQPESEYQSSFLFTK